MWMPRVLSWKSCSIQCAPGPLTWATPMHNGRSHSPLPCLERAVCSRPQGTPFIGMVTGWGLIVDGLWLNKDGYFLALQGIVDVDGVYQPI